MKSKYVFFFILAICLVLIFWKILESKDSQTISQGKITEERQLSSKTQRTVSHGGRASKDVDEIDSSAIGRDGFSPSGSFEESAMNALLEKDRQLRSKLLGEIITAWAGADPRLAFEWITSAGIKEWELQANLISIVFSTSLQNGSQELVRNLIEELPSGSLKDRVVSRQIRALAENDFEYAIGLVYAFSAERWVSSAANGLASVLLSTDNVDSLRDYLESLPHGMVRNNLGHALARKLAVRDPDAGLEFMASTPEVVSSLGIANLSRKFLERDPQEALKLGMKFESEKHRARFMGWIVQEWAENNREESLDWLVGSFENGGGMQGRENRVMFEQISKIALQQDQTYLFERLNAIEDEDLRNETTLKALEPLADLDPMRAIEMAMDLPGNRTRVIKDSMTNWLKRDPLAASAWIDDNLEDGADRDVAVNVLVNSIIQVEKDYESAVGWASTVSSETLKEQLLQKAESLKN